MARSKLKLQVMKNKSASFYRETVIRLETEIGGVEFETGQLYRHHGRLLGAIRNGLGPLCRHLKAENIHFSTGSLKNVYGEFSAAHHMFSAAPVNWGFRLTEQQVTKALAHFLSQPEYKVARLTAFMKAMGVCPPSDSQSLSDAAITAEADSTEKTKSGTVKRRGRIDLEILYEKLPLKKGGAAYNKALLIEAKLGHTVSRDQLANYRKTANKRAVHADLYILAQHEGDEEKLHHKQKNIWSVVYWDTVLIAFEKALAATNDSDSDFSRFRRTLWDRIDGSNRKR